MKIPDPHQLNFEYICNMSSAIQARHEKISRGYEYGLNWYEFIETDDQVYSLAVEYLESLSQEELSALIQETINDLLCKAENLRECL